jgi:hypothetical protein
MNKKANNISRLHSGTVLALYSPCFVFFNFFGGATMFTKVSFEVACKVFNGLNADYDLADNTIVCCITHAGNKSMFYSEIRANGFIVWSY